MRILVFISVIFFLSGCASSSKQTAEPAFEDTKGWSTVGEDVWIHSGKALRSSQREGKSYLVSPKAYQNFSLELEFLPDAIVNSGVFINCATNTQIGSKNCFEANISDKHKKPEFRTGSIVRHAPPGKELRTIGKWNKMVMTSNNGKITLQINGEVTAEVSSAAHPSGYIGLQRFKNGVIQFRNIKITTL